MNSSLLSIEYSPSPFTLLKNSTDFTCRLLFELDVGNIENISVTARQVDVLGFVDLRDGVQAKIETNAIWWAKTGYVSLCYFKRHIIKSKNVNQEPFQPIPIEGPIQGEFRGSSSNQTSITSRCGHSWTGENNIYHYATLNLVTKFGVVAIPRTGNSGAKGNEPWDRSGDVARSEKFTQTLLLGWEDCRRNWCVDRYGEPYQCPDWEV